LDGIITQIWHPLKIHGKAAEPNLLPQQSGLDYEKFMAGLLSYKTYSKELIDASEADATPFLKDAGPAGCCREGGWNVWPRSWTYPV
jgi:hypothetical protein